MRRFLLVPALLLCAAAPSQELKEATAETTAKARYGALLEEFEAAYKEWMGAYREAAKAGDQEALQKIFEERPNAAFARRFFEAAQKEQGADQAEYLVWIVQNGYGADDIQRQALDLILEHHLEHPSMKAVAQQMRYGAGTFGKDKARRLLDALVEKNPDEGVVAAALFSRATMDMRHGKLSPEERTQACEDLKRVIAMDVDPRTTEYAKGALFEFEHLQIGMIAPDIEGEDLDGEPFKLSDYRGKVVVLDFWGDW